MLPNQIALVDFLLGKVPKRAYTWDKVSSLAISLGLGGSLYTTIRTLSKKSNLFVYDSSKLENFYNLNIKRNLIIQSELKRLFKKYDSFNPVLLKGLSTINYSKQDLGSKYLSDIDILSINFSSELFSSLLSDNYIIHSNYSKLVHNKLFYHLRPLKKIISKTSILVEIHNGLTFKDSPFKIDLDKLSYKIIFLDKLKITSLSAEDLIIILSKGVAYDDFLFMGIRTIFDMSYIIKNNKLNWKSLVSKSKDFGCSSFVYYCMYLCKILFNTNIPTNYFDELRTNSISRQLIILSFGENNLFKYKSSYFSKFRTYFFKSLLSNSFGSFLHFWFNAFLLLLSKKRKQYN